MDKRIKRERELRQAEIDHIRKLRADLTGATAPSLCWAAGELARQERAIRGENGYPYDEKSWQ